MHELYDIKNSVWISASAGSGKTTALVRRLLNLLLCGVSPENILCLTFTNNAANEMITRVYDYLARWSVISDEVLCEELLPIVGSKNLLSDKVSCARSLYNRTTLDGLRIKTIHSFCSEVMSSFVLESNLSPGFAAADESKQAEMLKEAIDIYCSENYEQWSNLFFFTEGQIMSCVKDILHYNMHSLSDDALHDRVCMLKDLFHVEHENADELFKIVYGSEGDSLPIFVDQCQSYGSELLRRWFESTTEDRLLMLNEYKSLFLTAANKKRSRGVDEVFKNSADASGFFEKEAELLQDLCMRISGLQLYQCNVTLLNIANDVARVYEGLKKKYNLVDYDDQIGCVYRLLNSSEDKDWIGYMMDQRIDHLLVDEAQDNSEYQWGIVRPIAENLIAEQIDDKDRSIFVVGDVKQSIYGFQGSRPEDFISMRDYLVGLARGWGKSFVVHDSNTSYRCGAEILSFVDKLFSDIEFSSRVNLAGSVGLVHDCPEIGSHSGVVRLYALMDVDSSSKDNDFRGWDLNCSELGDTTGSGNKVELAKYIALMIRERLDKEDCIVDTGQKIKPADIMILLRQRADFIEILTSALRDCGLECISDSYVNVLNNGLVRPIVSLIKYLLDQSDVMSLCIALRSPIFNCGEEIVSNLSCRDYDVEGTAIEGDLQSMRERIASLTPYDFFLWLLYDLSVQKSFVSAFGDEVVEMIELFLGFVWEKQASGANDMYGMLCILLEQKDLTKKGGIAAYINKIRIVTAHAAKGQESPIVIMPDAANLTFKHSNPVCYAGVPLYIDNDYEACSLIKERIVDREYSEYLRLMYVAVTRAKNELHIFGWKPGRASAGSRKSWYDIAKCHLPVVELESNLVACEASL